MAVEQHAVLSVGVEPNQDVDDVGPAHRASPLQQGVDSDARPRLEFLLLTECTKIEEPGAQEWRAVAAPKFLPGERLGDLRVVDVDHEHDSQILSFVVHCPIIHRSALSLQRFAAPAREASVKARPVRR
jgi:hypothetical protein